MTLDPARDTPEVLATIATARNLQTPPYHLVTGDPAAVEAVLDHMSVARSRDPETGVIDHANLFLLVDRSGHVAYRFSLGDLQEEWLLEGLRLLLAEPDERP